MYELRMTSARVDFGNDNFASVELEDTLLIGGKKTLKELVESIKEFLEKRGGQVVDTNNEYIVLDTNEMTISCLAQNSGEINLTEAQVLEFSALITQI